LLARTTVEMHMEVKSCILNSLVEGVDVEDGEIRLINRSLPLHCGGVRDSVESLAGLQGIR
jgi:hypothetical protein